MEALGLAKPVIACEGVAGPEDIKRLCPHCIELVKPQHVESLVQGIKALIEKPDKRQRMGQLGQQLVSEQFTWEQNAKNTMQIYKQLLHS